MNRHPRTHVKKGATFRRHIIAGLVVIQHLSKADVLRWTDLKNGSVQNALKWLTKEGIIQRIEPASHSYAATIRARRTLGLEKPREFGGTPPTLYAPDSYWRLYQHEITAAMDSIFNGRLPVDGVEKPRQAIQTGKVHRIHLKASIQAPHVWSRMEPNPEPSPLLPEALQCRPQGTTRTNRGLNAIIEHTQPVEVDGVGWWCKWIVSKNGWQTVNLQLKKESHIFIALDGNENETAIELYDYALSAIRHLERQHNCSLDVKTSFEAFKAGVEVALSIDDPQLNQLLYGVKKTIPKTNGYRIKVDTPQGPVWIDESEGSSKFEVETTLNGASRLVETRDKLLQILQDPMRDESHHLMMIEEFHNLDSKLNKILNLLEAV